MLDNERVQVQRIVVLPADCVRLPSRPAAQLLVYIVGGRLADPTGRIVVWTAGRVRWFDGDHGEIAETNVGIDPIVIVTVTLKALPAGAASPGHSVRPLSYPNLAGEDLLENDVVIVQRFVIDPGQWEGVHAHQPNMLYIHITSGQWAARSSFEPQAVIAEPSAVGEVGWMDPVDITVGHESGNVGSSPIDFVWVSLKQ